MTHEAVAFGFCATSVAMRAKTGHATDRDRLELAENLLRNQPGDAAARAAVLTFLRESQSSAKLAGDALFQFVETWTAVPRVIPDAEPIHDWQRRADING